MKHQKTGIVVAATALGIFAGMQFRQEPPTLQARTAVAPVQTVQGLSSLSLPLGRPDLATHKPETAHEPEPGESRAQQVDRLINGSPADALVAVRMISYCHFARMQGKVVAKQLDPQEKASQAAGAPPIDGACEGVGDGTHQVQTLQLALKAAEGHEPGAFAVLLPLATLEPYRDDPLLLSKYDAIRDYYVAHGDSVALMSRWLYFSQCDTTVDCTNRDPAQALKMWTALQGVQPWKGGDTYTAGYIKTLGEERAKEMIAEGNLIVANAKAAK